MNLPLFPLHTVLCPGVELSLHVFEDRYRTMVGRCLADESPFGVVLIREGSEVGPGDLAVAAVGTVAEIRRATPRADGRYDLLVRGMQRFRLDGVDAAAEPYLVGHVTPMGEVLGERARVALLRDRVVQLFTRYLQAVRIEERAGHDGGLPLGQGIEALRGDHEAAGAPWAIRSLDPEQPIGFDTMAPIADHAAPDDAALGHTAPDLGIPRDPTVLSHVLSGIVQVEALRRQGLLEMPTTERRLEELEHLLELEIALLQRGLGTYSPDPRLSAIRRN